jgi:hypothetical protein
MSTTKITASCNGSVPFTAVGRPRGNVMIGRTDVASNVVETPQDVADTVRAPSTGVYAQRISRSDFSSLPALPESPASRVISHSSILGSALARPTACRFLDTFLSRIDGLLGPARYAGAE